MVKGKGKGARRTKKDIKTPVSMRVRGAIRELSLAGMANCDIEKALKVGHTTVQKWANKSPPEKLKRERKSCIDLEKAKRACVKIRFGSAAKASSLFINPKIKKPVHPTTVQRRLKKGGFISVRVKKTPLLTGKHRERRLQFKEDHKDEDWKAWDFSDEKLFEVGGVKGNERMYVDKNDPNPDERFVGKVAHPIKVMVWGAVSYTGRSSLRESTFIWVDSN